MGEGATNQNALQANPIDQTKRIRKKRPLFLSVLSVIIENRLSARSEMIKKWCNIDFLLRYFYGGYKK